MDYLIRQQAPQKILLFLQSYFKFSELNLFRFFIFHQCCRAMILFYYAIKDLFLSFFTKVKFKIANQVNYRQINHSFLECLRKIKFHHHDSSIQLTDQISYEVNMLYYFQIKFQDFLKIKSIISYHFMSEYPLNLLSII